MGRNNLKKSRSSTWHPLQTEEVVRLLDVDLETGLVAEEVKRRQKKFGLNRIAAHPGRPAWLKFLQQFNQPLVYILLVAVVVTALLGEWVDASVIFAVVLVNAVIGFLQEAKAEKAIESLSQMVATETTVRRDGRKQRIHSEQLVPGDVVLLQSGDRVPADCGCSTSRACKWTSLHSLVNPCPSTSNPTHLRSTRCWVTGRIWPTPARSSRQARVKGWSGPPPTNAGEALILLTAIVSAPRYPCCQCNCFGSI